MKKLGMTLAVTTLLMGTANAATYDFSESGDGVSVNGVFTTSGSAIVSISGTYSDSDVGGGFTSGAITGLVANNSNPSWNSDNSYSAATGLLGGTVGILFSVAGLSNDVNVWSNGAAAYNGYGISSSYTGYVNGTDESTNGYQLTPVTLSISAVPEPATLALMLAGLGLLSVVLRRKA